MLCLSPSILILLGICSFIISVLLFLRALSRFRLSGVLLWLVIVFFSTTVFFTGVFSKTFFEFNREELVARVHCERAQAMEYDFTLIYTPLVKGEEQPSLTFPIRGTEWMLSGDIVKWKPYINILGVHTYYRLTRLSGRYPSRKNNMRLSDTAYRLSDETVMTIFLRKVLRKLPFVDATYGNAVYTACEPGKTFKVYVGTSGFIIRTQDK